MAEAQQKAIPVRYLPSAQPYIAPPPKITAPEILATQTAKAPPKAQDILATQTSKAPPQAQDILATQASKAKPKGAPRLEDRTPTVITPQFAASSALYNINSFKQLSTADDESSRLNAKLRDPSIEKDDKKRTELAIRSQTQMANRIKDQIKTNYAVAIRHVDTVKTIYDRAV